MTGASTSAIDSSTTHCPTPAITLRHSATPISARSPLIKLQVSYSKKVPADEQYSSKSFHAALEVKVSDDVARSSGQLEQKLRSLWSDLEKAVENQIASSNGKSVTPAPSTPRTNGNNGENASPKQINYLTLLARKAKNWGLADLDAHVKTRFGNGGVYEMSKSDASMLIEEFREMTGQGARR